MPKNKYYDSSYRNMDGDAMLKEDRSAIANMPQGEIYREYPKYGAGYVGKLKDGPQAIREQVTYDDSAMMRNLSKSKY